MIARVASYFKANALIDESLNHAVAAIVIYIAIPKVEKSRSGIYTCRPPALTAVWLHCLSLVSQTTFFFYIQSRPNIKEKSGVVHETTIVCMHDNLNVQFATESGDS